VTIDCPVTEQRLQRRYWFLAAVLFIGGGLGAIPADAIHRPEHDSSVYLLPLLAIVSGLVCIAAANHVPRRWLHLMTSIATIEIALTVWLAADVFAIYYILVAFYAAYVFQSRWAVAFQFALASMAALAPAVYEPDTGRETIEQGMVLIPTLLLTAGAITYLRERLEASELRYRQLSERDPLTGVANYRVLTERLPAEVDRHRRHGRPLAVLVIDLDDFKRVNDEHGHQDGDRVLQEVAGALMGSVRAHDVVVRHGGDEFSVIAPETDRDQAEALAERLRAAISRLSVHGRHISASVGCAIFPEDGDTVNKLLAQGDLELRGVKSSRPRLARSSIGADA
jgi:diguanylate cyclase (GGDEF)-like protein